MGVWGGTMQRKLESYASCTPEAVAGGSVAQMQYFVKDAKADVAWLAGRVATLEDAIVEIERLMDSVDGSITKSAIMRTIAGVVPCA